MKMRKILNLLENVLSDKELRDLCEQHGIRDYVVVNGKVNVKNFYRNGMMEFVQIPVPFGAAEQFTVNRCGITNLHNSPETVSRWFTVSDNIHLTTLEGGPKIVGDYFLCAKTSIQNLRGAPEYIGNYFVCNHSHVLQSLDGLPLYIRDGFHALNCPRLPFEEYTKIALVDHIGFVRTGCKWLDDPVNHCLDNIDGELSSYKNKLPLHKLIVRLVGENK